MKHRSLLDLAGVAVLFGLYTAGLPAAERETTVPVLRGSSATSPDVRALESDRLLTLTSVHFAPGSSDVKLDDRAALDNLAGRLGGVNESVIELRGYADGAGTSARNLALSIERATAIARFLSEHGIPSQRILIIGLGEVDPAGSELNPEHQRVDIRVFEKHTPVEKGDR